MKHRNLSERVDYYQTLYEESNYTPCTVGAFYEQQRFLYIEGVAVNLDGFINETNSTFQELSIRILALVSLVSRSIHNEKV